MADSALRTRPAVPLAQVGTWMASTGEWTCTAPNLADAVLASRDPHFRPPVVRLGHADPRFDGEPAVGRVENLRLSGDGQTLLGDLVGIPAWLDDVLESAYPSRSIEADLDVRTVEGARYGMVLTGLALLGVQAPAIESLAGIADLYGVSTDITDYVAASRVAASLPEEPMPRRKKAVVASASIEELCAAFEIWSREQPLLGGDCWVRDVYTDSVIATVWLAGGETRLYRCTWAEADEGAFTFGDPERVKQAYVPYGGDVAAAYAATCLSYDVSAGRARHETPDQVPSRQGRGAITAGDASQGVLVPISPALAAALGVGEDADDEIALAALERLRVPAEPEPTPEPITPVDGGTGPAPAATTTEAPDLDTRIAAAVRAATAPMLSTIEQLSTDNASMRTDRQSAERDRVIRSAVEAGKITPADRAHWEAQYDQAPGVVASILDKIAANSAVPMTAAGRLGSEAEDALDAEWKLAAGASSLLGGAVRG